MKCARHTELAAIEQESKRQPARDSRNWRSVVACVHRGRLSESAEMCFFTRNNVYVRLKNAATSQTAIIDRLEEEQTGERF